ncbi:hypothetical protein [Metabacillus idriensis]|uniref:hypothetical protein n=1 Tax=Metabacillus idriensis TaxID=324768 RepID=UPI00174D3306|nr:hypothetical protein [Metabacillus idriensis]
MKKTLSVLLLFLLLISGCASNEKDENNQENKKEEMKDSETKTNGSSTGTTQNEEIDQDEKKAETVQSKVSKNEADKKTDSEKTASGPYMEYRPKEGTKKEFKEDGVVLLTEHVVAVTDEYVQIAMTLGESTTTQIYKWTGSEITLVFEDREIEDHTKNMLNSFDANLNEKLAGEEADWKMLDDSAAVETPYGKHEDVLIIQKTSNEVVNEESIFTRYYAPELGLVKEDFELTGENGYKGESSLSSIE